MTGTVSTELESLPGVFYALTNGHFLPTVKVGLHQELNIDQKLPVGGFFDIYICTIDGARVGFYFTSRFPVRNGGGFIVAHMGRKQEAETCETLIRTDDLIVYDYPNRGTLAICPKVSEEIATIFEEQ